MQPGWRFTEKNFYLEEFRGRGLAIALPEPELADRARLDSVLADLASNRTRVILLSPHRTLLEKLVPGDVIEGPGRATDEAIWVGRIWHVLREQPRAALLLGDASLPADCRQVALRLGLAKLVWLDRHGRVELAGGGKVSMLAPSDIERLVDQAGDALARPELLPVLREIGAMVQGGVPTVNLCSLEGLADELFTYEGSGTFFTRERHATVRPLALDDFDAAADLIARGVEEGYLVARGEAEQQRVLAYGFGVFIEKRYLAGIGSLLPFPAGGGAEISSLYTVTRFLGEGVGAQLVRYAVERAAEQGHEEVFACTTSERVEAFFMRHGFERVPATSLPAQKWEGYSPERRERLRCLRCRTSLTGARPEETGAG